MSEPSLRQGESPEPGIPAARRRQFHILVGMWYPGADAKCENSVCLAVKLSETIIATALKVGASASLTGEDDDKVRVLVDGVCVEFEPCRKRGLALARTLQKEVPPVESAVQTTMLRLLKKIDLAYDERQELKHNRATKKRRKRPTLPKGAGSGEKKECIEVEGSSVGEKSGSDSGFDATSDDSDDEPLTHAAKRHSLAVLSGRTVDTTSPRGMDLLRRYILFNFEDGWREGHVRKFYATGYRGSQEQQYDLGPGASVNQTLPKAKQKQTNSGGSPDFHWILLDVPPCKPCAVCRRNLGKKRRS